MTIAPAKRDQYCRPINADEAIQAHLRGRKGAKITRRFSFTISAIYDLGGAIGLLHWAAARLDQSIGLPAEQSQLRTLLKTCSTAQRRHNKQLIREWEAEQQRDRYVQLWVSLLNARDLQLRAQSQRQAPPGAPPKATPEEPPEATPPKASEAPLRQEQPSWTCGLSARQGWMIYSIASRIPPG